MEIKYVIEPQFNGCTPMEILSKKFLMSRNMIKKVKLYGRLDINGEHRKMRDIVYAGDEMIAGYEDEADFLRPESETGIHIYFEDDWYAVLEKPAGMVTHPTHGHLDDSLLTALSEGTLHPVMRLDRDTSGLIAVAKNGYAHNTIMSLGMHKKYMAVVYGRYINPEGVIDKPIKRRPESVMIRDVTDKTDPDGKESITDYKEIYYDEKNNVSLVEFSLRTGRCHQIRVHSTSEGHPLVGDGLYGPLSIDNPNPDITNANEMDPIIGRQALHAYSLVISDPRTMQAKHYISYLPDDILRLLPELSRERADQLLREINGL